MTQKTDFHYLQHGVQGEDNHPEEKIEATQDPVAVAARGFSMQLV
jgi:hypothetical protein